MMLPSFVQNKQTAWLIYKEATTWHCRPSDILALEDTYVAFCFDQAIGAWGNTIQGEMDAVDGKTAEEQNAKRKQILMKWLDGEDKPSPGRFADPAGMFR